MGSHLRLCIRPCERVTVETQNSTHALHIEPRGKARFDVKPTGTSNPLKLLQKSSLPLKLRWQTKKSKVHVKRMTCSAKGCFYKRGIFLAMFHSLLPKYLNLSFTSTERFLPPLEIQSCSLEPWQPWRPKTRALFR